MTFTEDRRLPRGAASVTGAAGIDSSSICLRRPRSPCAALALAGNCTMRQVPNCAAGQLEVETLIYVNGFPELRPLPFSFAGEDTGATSSESQVVPSEISATTAGLASEGSESKRARGLAMVFNPLEAVRRGLSRATGRYERQGPVGDVPGPLIRDAQPRRLEAGSCREWEAMRSDLEIDPDDADIWRWPVHDRDAMVRQLLRQPAAPIAEHGEIPVGPGVYLVPCGAEAVLVALVTDLRRQLHAALDPDGEDGSTYLSFHLARWKAGQAGLDIPPERELLEADPAFREIYTQTKAEVPQLLVRYLTLGELLQGQLLALYSHALTNPTDQYGRQLG